MKIAFFDYPWTIAEPPSIGSIRIISYQLGLRLTRTNHDVIFYGSKGNYQELNYYEDGILYRRIPDNILDKILEPLNYLDTWQISNPKRPFYGSRLYYLGYYWQIAKDLQLQKCDVIHVHLVSQFVSLIKAFNPQVKIVLHMHCEWLTQFDSAMVERQLKQVDLVLTCSDYITNKIRHKFPHVSCQTIFNGVDVNHFLPTNQDGQPKENRIKQLLYVGRISPEKGIHILLNAFNKVVSEYPQVQLKIIGPKNAILPWEMLDREDPNIVDLIPFYKGDYNAHLQAQISPNAVDSVLFTGEMQYLELAEHYQQADIFVFPSVWNEPFGMPIVEAMAMELPVIATRAGAFPEIVEEGKTGLLVERGDADALAEAILALLRDKNRCQAMGKAGRQRTVEKFSWEPLSESLIEQYQKICDRTIHNELKSNISSVIK